MTRIDINGVSINYEIVGERGPSMALSPGGRNGYAAIKPFAWNMADKGYRVLLHDRRNTGSSDVAFDCSRSEYEVWADDLELLMQELDMAPAIVGGSSSGARLAITFALRHPHSVRALMLWRVTGGGFAVKRLAERYYDQYVRLASEGGMAAVCAEEHFAELIRNRPSNRDRLMAMDVDAFVACMKAWRVPFVAGAELPVVGASDAELRSIKVSTMIIPGNDLTHNSGTGDAAARCISDCEIHRLPMPDQNVDMVPTDEWYAQAGDIASIFAEFLARKLPRQAATSVV
ncbi:MAG: alpha/beta fold hydrolase [Xanthobacteraceae bacterium]